MKPLAGNLLLIDGFQLESEAAERGRRQLDPRSLTRSLGRLDEEFFRGAQAEIFKLDRTRIATDERNFFSGPTNVRPNLSSPCGWELEARVMITSRSPD